MLEAVRIVADWLGNATYGVNAKLDDLDYDGTDTAPDDVATITDVTRNGAVARERLPATLPALTVSLGEFRQDGEVMTDNRRDGEVTVLVRYGTSDSDTAAAIRDGLYTLRAVVESLRELHRNANQASRTRNGRHLMTCTDLRMQSLYEELEGATVTAGLAVTYITRDTTV